MNLVNQNHLSRRSLFRSIMVLMGIILLGSVLVYGLNTQLWRTAYFIFVLLFFIFTRDNVLGIAVLFILAQNPWGLFYYQPYEWLLPVTSTVGISYKVFFNILIFIKVFSIVSQRKVFIKDYFRPYYRFLVIYLIFLILWGLFFGHSAKSLFDLVLSLIVFLLFIGLPVFFDNISIFKFNRIIFLFCLIHTIFAYIDILSSGSITNLLFFTREVPTAAIWDTHLVRLTGGIVIAFYSMITGLYYLTSGDKNFKSWYLLLVIMVSLFYILNSATRGWMIASIFLLLAYFLYYSKSVFSANFLMVSVVIVLFWGLLISLPPIRENISAAFERLETVESISEGDLTAGGTASRWNIRGPKVLTRFKESPVLGFGFSKITSEYYDNHVGNHSILLMGGILGLTIIWLTILLIIIFLYRLERKTKSLKGIFVFGIALSAIMIIHSTSRAMISYMMPTDIAFVIALFFNHINTRITSINRYAIMPRNINNETEEDFKAVNP